MSLQLTEQLRARHSGISPDHTHGLVIAETWNSKIAEWWGGNDKARPRWHRSPLSRPREYGIWQYGFLTVRAIRPGPEGTLFWLYGISPELNPPASDEVARLAVVAPDSFSRR
ncbi:MAG: hypothetical protein HY000_34490 [Planctomycetes bacterium]|nr:hypothetical protein [Planctomycetota bacterium]